MVVDGAGAGNVIDGADIMLVESVASMLLVGLVSYDTASVALTGGFDKRAFNERITSSRVVSIF